MHHQKLFLICTVHVAPDNLLSPEMKKTPALDTCETPRFTSDKMLVYIFIHVQKTEESFIEISASIFQQM